MATLSSRTFSTLQFDSTLPTAGKQAPPIPASTSTQPNISRLLVWKVKCSFSVQLACRASYKLWAKGDLHNQPINSESRKANAISSPQCCTGTSHGFKPSFPRQLLKHTHTHTHKLWVYQTPF